MASMIGHLIYVNPKEAEERILKAIWDAGCHKGRAADAFGVRHGTLIDWIKKLDIGAKVEKLVEQGKKSGHASVDHGGPPNGPRPFEAVDSKGVRLGTFASIEAARDRAREIPGARARKRIDLGEASQPKRRRSA